MKLATTQAKHFHELISNLIVFSTFCTLGPALTAAVFDLTAASNFVMVVPNVLRAFAVFGILLFDFGPEVGKVLRIVFRLGQFG